METPPLDLKEYQHACMEHACSRLRMMKHVRPVALIMADTLSFRAYLAKHPDLAVLKLAADDAGPSDGAPFAGIGLPIMGNSDKMQFQMMSHSNPPQGTTMDIVMRTIEAMGKACKIDDPWKDAMDIMRSKWDLEEKDITSTFIHTLSVGIPAFAVLTTMESWVIKSDTPIGITPYRAFHKDPRSIEYLMVSLETRAEGRMLARTVKRNPSPKGRDQGKVIGFGELEEWQTKGEGAPDAKGRFTWFFEDASASQ